MNISDIIAKYEAPPAQVAEAAVLIRINRFYRRWISPKMLYEITRGKWKMGNRREKAMYAFAVYRRVIREVYQIHSWVQADVDDTEEMMVWIKECGEYFEPN
ncbi:MAG: hypothetical protein ABIP78_13465 [Pyrinomonadaceae bacterium]